MKIFYGVLLSFALASACFAAGRIEFKNYGFSIEQMSVNEEDKGDVFQPVVLLLPAKGQGFSPNVNIQEQKFDGTIDDYAGLSDSQFENMGVTAEKKKSGKTLTYEYTFDMNGTEMHVYSKAFFEKGKVYLVTATSLASQWDDAGPALKKNVDSFKVLK